MNGGGGRADYRHTIVAMPVVGGSHSLGELLPRRRSSNTRSPFVAPFGNSTAVSSPLVRQGLPNLRSLSTQCGMYTDCASCSSAFPKCAWCGSSRTCMNSPASLVSAVVGASLQAHVVYSHEEYTLTYSENAGTVNVISDDTCGMWLFNPGSCVWVQGFCTSHGDTCAGCSVNGGCGYCEGGLVSEPVCIAGSSSGPIGMNGSQPPCDGGRWIFGDWNQYYSTGEWMDPCTHECDNHNANAPLTSHTGSIALGDDTRYIAYPSGANCMWELRPDGLDIPLVLKIKFDAIASQGDTILIYERFNGSGGSLVGWGGCPTTQHSCIYVKYAHAQPPVLIHFLSTYRPAGSIVLGAFEVTWSPSGLTNHFASSLHGTFGSGNEGFEFVWFCLAFFLVPFLGVVLFLRWRCRAQRDPTARTGVAIPENSRRQKVDIERLERDLPSCRPYRVEAIPEGAGAGACSVCLGELELDEEVRKLPCGHVFHRPCIDSWLGRSTVCPMCRASALPPSLVVRQQRSSSSHASSPAASANTASRLMRSWPPDRRSAVASAAASAPQPAVIGSHNGPPDARADSEPTRAADLVV